MLAYLFGHLSLFMEQISLLVSRKISQEIYPVVSTILLCVCMCAWGVYISLLSLACRNKVFLTSFEIDFTLMRMSRERDQLKFYEKWRANFFQSHEESIGLCEFFKFCCIDKGVE